MIRALRRLWHKLHFFIVIITAVHAVALAASPTLLVETWRIKPGGKQPHDYWIDGAVKNISNQRVTDVYLLFAVETAGGKVLGETRAAPKLSTLLPDQECLFAAQVSVHDRRMYKMILANVTAGMVGDAVMFKGIPFSSKRTTAFFAGVRREKKGHNS